MDPAKVKEIVEEAIDGMELVDESKVVDICNGLIDQVAASLQTMIQEKTTSLQTEMLK